MTSSLTELLAHDLEAARLAASEAAANYQEALSRAEKIQARLAEAAAKRQSITEKRLRGESTPEEANEFAALGADIDALSVMLTKAQAEADSALPEQAQSRLHTAEAAWTRHQQQEVIQAVHDRAIALENRFIDCLQELASLIAQAGGQNLRDHWTPSEALEVIMRHSRPQTVANAVRRAA